MRHSQPTSNVTQVASRTCVVENLPADAKTAEAVQALLSSVGTARKVPAKMTPPVSTLPVAPPPAPALAALQPRRGRASWRGVAPSGAVPMRCAEPTRPRCRRMARCRRLAADAWRDAYAWHGADACAPWPGRLCAAAFARPPTLAMPRARCRRFPHLLPPARASVSLPTRFPQLACSRRSHCAAHGSPRACARGCAQPAPRPQQLSPLPPWSCGNGCGPSHPTPRRRPTRRAC